MLGEAALARGRAGVGQRGLLVLNGRWFRGFGGQGFVPARFFV